jgi:hypothetical protein
MKVVRVSLARREGAVTLLEMRHLIAVPDGIEDLVDHHKLTLFSPKHYEAALRGAGLTIEAVTSPMEGRDRYVGVRGA